jgi:replicative DNA helicase
LKARAASTTLESVKHSFPRDTSTSDAPPKPVTPTPRLWSLAALIGEVVSDAADAHEARKMGQPRGPMTGLKQLDQKIGGALPKDALTMILGNTGTGKTAFAGQIVADCGCPAVYLTTEMAPVELLRRHTARGTKTFLGRLKSGELPPTEVERLVTQTAQKLSHLSLVDGTTAYASIAYLRDVMDAAKGDAKHALLVIDSLHTWARGSGTGAGEYDALNDHLTALGRLAKQAHCSIVVICEQNRAAMKDGASGNPNAGAGTRFIEYSADLLFDLDAKKTIDGAGEKAVTLTLSKNRNGAAGETLALEFNGALQRFREVEK